MGKCECGYEPRAGDMGMHLCASEQSALAQQGQQPRCIADWCKEPRATGEAFCEGHMPSNGTRLRDEAKARAQQDPNAHLLDVLLRPEGKAEAAKALPKTHDGEPVYEAHLAAPRTIEEALFEDSSALRIKLADEKAKTVHLETDLARKRDECGRLEAHLADTLLRASQAQTEANSLRIRIGELDMENAKLRRELGRAKR